MNKRILYDFQTYTCNEFVKHSHDLYLNNPFVLKIQNGVRILFYMRMYNNNRNRLGPSTVGLMFNVNIYFGLILKRKQFTRIRDKTFSELNAKINYTYCN